jgi:hypothetical protein
MADWGSIGLGLATGGATFAADKMGLFDSPDQPGAGSAVPKFHKDPLKQYSQELQNYIGTPGPGYFPGQTYAGMSGYTGQGIEELGGVNYAPSNEYLQSTLAGDYLGLSPEMMGAVMGPAMEASAARFASSGRYGSPASQVAMTKAGMEAAMPYYDQERQRQQEAAGLAPAMQSQQALGLLSAGGLEEDWQQKQINEDMARYEYEQNLPYTQLQQQSTLFGPFGPPVSGYEPAGGSQLASMAGGALAGGVAGAEFGLPGAIAGGLLGGYGGYVGAS